MPEGHLPVRSYLAVPVTDLRRDRSINPLSPDELDAFSQNLVALSHTRQRVTQLTSKNHQLDHVA